MEKKYKSIRPYKASEYGSVHVEQAIEYYQNKKCICISLHCKEWNIKAEFAVGASQRSDKIPNICLRTQNNKSLSLITFPSYKGFNIFSYRTFCNECVICFLKE